MQVLRIKMDFIVAKEGEEEGGKITLVKHGLAEKDKFGDKLFS